MNDVEIPEVDLDFIPEVADRILEQLSFGFNDISVWNVPGAPSIQQLREYWKEHKTEFTSRQVENVDKVLLNF